MNKEETMLEAMTRVRPEVLNEPTLKLFNEIMKVIDERDELIRISSKLSKECDRLTEENCKITKSILNETTTFCNECASKDCCPENECVLYRIEQLGEYERKQ